MMRSRERILARAAAVAALAGMVAVGFTWEAAARSRADSLVTGFDLEACIAKHAEGLVVSRIAPLWGVGLEALAVEPATREILHVAVGVFGSSSEAGEAAEARVVDSSVRLEETTGSDDKLGERSWRTDLSVTFHRANVVVQVFGSSPDRVQEVAKIIDREIEADDDDAGNDVEWGSRVMRPSLSGVSSPAGNLPVGGELEIRLTGSSIGGRQVFYCYHPVGGELLGGDPPVPLQFRASTTGSHVLRFASIDDHCVMSPVLEMPVTVVEAGK